MCGALQLVLYNVWVYSALATTMRLGVVCCRAKGSVVDDYSLQKSEVFRRERGGCNLLGEPSDKGIAMAQGIIGRRDAYPTRRGVIEEAASLARVLRKPVGSAVCTGLVVNR